MRQTIDVFLTGLAVMVKMTVVITQMRGKKTAQYVIQQEISDVRTDAAYQNAGCVTLMMTAEITLMRISANVVSSNHIETIQSIISNHVIVFEEVRTCQDKMLSLSVVYNLFHNFICRNEEAIGPIVVGIQFVFVFLVCWDHNSFLLKFLED